MANHCLRAVGSRSPMTYRHEFNAVKLHEIDFFVSLLEDIRNHFLISEFTQLVYASITEQFFLALDPTLQWNLRRPTQQDFYNYIFYKWPTFCSYRTPCRLGGIDWEGVGKGDHEPNEVHIASDVVISAAVSLTFSTSTKTNRYRHGIIIAAFLLIFTS